MKTWLAEKPVIDEINRLMYEQEREGRTPIRIEIGWAQAQALADELYVPPRDDLDALIASFGLPSLPPLPPCPTAEQIYAGPGVRQLFGVRLQGVESPDYLAVVAEDGA